MKKSPAREVRFELEAESGSQVAVAGTFNDWDPTRTPMKDNPGSGKFATTAKLSPGRHEYSSSSTTTGALIRNAPNGRRTTADRSTALSASNRPAYLCGRRCGQWRRTSVKARILLVDDCDLMRGVVADCLKQELPDCECREASDGETGVEEARKQQPDVVIMDIRLPGMDGIEATRRIMSHLPNTAVIVFSLSDTPEYRRAAREVGACAYVLKDDGAEELSSVVRRCIGDRRRRKSKLLCLL